MLPSIPHFPMFILSPTSPRSVPSRPNPLRPATCRVLFTRLACRARAEPAFGSTSTATVGRWANCAHVHTHTTATTSTPPHVHDRTHAHTHTHPHYTLSAPPSSSSTLDPTASPTTLTSSLVRPLAPARARNSRMHLLPPTFVRNLPPFVILRLRDPHPILRSLPHRSVYMSDDRKHPSPPPQR